MTSTLTYVGYIAMSLDGFIADADGGVQWLDPFNQALAADGGDGGFSEFIGEIDALVMGRTTYQQVMGWGWPYENRPAYVLTRQPGFSGDHIAVAGDIETLGRAMAAAGHRRVWIMGGGETQRAALDAGMFDDLGIFIMPILLGGGLPCFANGVPRNLNLISSEQLPGGIIRADYKFATGEAGQ